MILDDSHSSSGERSDVSLASGSPETASPLAGDPIVSSDLPALHLWMDGPVPVLRFPESTGFEVLRAALREQMPRLSATIAGRSIRLDFGARDIVLFDLRRILHALRQEFSLEATGLYAKKDAIHRFAERELKLKLFAAEDRVPFPTPRPSPPVPEEDARTEMFEAPEASAAPAVEAAPAPAPPPALAELRLPNDLDAAALGEPEPRATAPAVAPALVPSTPAPAPAREEGRRAQTVQRTLRSGTVLRYDGDLYVFGDVNPGAQIIATGNITVLGALKGTAHAGAGGDESAFILAFDLRPMQLRIGRVIAIPPDRRAEPDLNPEIASVKDGQVVMESYRGRLR